MISMSVQPKSGDVYAIGIQGAGCFAARNSSGSFMLTCYNWLFTFWWAKQVRSKIGFLNNSRAFEYFSKIFVGNYS